MESAEFIQRLMGYSMDAANVRMGQFQTLPLYSNTALAQQYPGELVLYFLTLKMTSEQRLMLSDQFMTQQKVSSHNEKNKRKKQRKKDKLQASASTSVNDPD